MKTLIIRTLVGVGCFAIGLLTGLDRYIYLALFASGVGHLANKLGVKIPLVFFRKHLLSDAIRKAAIVARDHGWRHTDAIIRVCATGVDVRAIDNIDQPSTVLDAAAVAGVWTERLGNDLHRSVGKSRMRIDQVSDDTWKIVIWDKYLFYRTCPKIDIHFNNCDCDDSLKDYATIAEEIRFTAPLPKPLCKWLGQRTVTRSIHRGDILAYGYGIVGQDGLHVHISVETHDGVFADFGTPFEQKSEFMVSLSAGEAVTYVTQAWDI